MALDPYSPCPAGTGKKLKFCCADLIGELEKIQRMLEGEQRLGCLEYIEKLETQYPGRACLLTTKAMLLMELGRMDDAKSAVAAVLQQAPANPVALADAALLTISDGDLQGAVEKLQQALAACLGPIPSRVVEAVAALSESLLALGHMPAALGHLLLVASLLPKDERTLSLIMRLNASPQVPLLFKEEPDLKTSLADSAHRQKFEEAMEPSRRGAWRVAEEKLVALAASLPTEPAIWQNLAVLRAWLADEPGAVDALRRLAQLDVPLDDKVEAEALAQLLDQDAAGNRIDLVALEYPVQNIDELVEKLSDRRFVPIASDPSAWTEQNEAPPRLSFALVDRVPPTTGVGLSRDAIPNVLAHILLFGRQTDREARLEVSVARPHLAATQESLQKLCGATLGPAGPEKVRDGIPVTQWALSWNWRLPEDTPVNDVHKLLVAERRRGVLKRWTETPLPVLLGKTPRQAAADESLRIALSAAILLLELSFQEPSSAGLFTELRTNLGLAEPPVLDPNSQPVTHIPLARMHRVDWTKADDDALLIANRRAMFTGAQRATRLIALEILGRERLKTRIPFAQIYGLLSRLEDDTSQAIEYLDQARRVADDAKESTAMWDLQELALRLDRGEAEEFGRVLSHIQTHHAREPGVSAALMQILVEAGLMTPDGRPTRAPEDSPALVVPGGGAEPGKIWTPEGESGGGKKSALWVPGAE